MKKTFILFYALLICSPTFAQKPKKVILFGNPEFYKIDSTLKTAPLHEFKNGFFVAQDSTATKYSPKDTSEIVVIPIFAQIVVLSLVSTSILENWDKEIEKIKKNYANQTVLLAVSANDSKQRADFMIGFHEYSQKMKLKEAYQKAVQMIEKRYDRLDFKHYLHSK